MPRPAAKNPAFIKIMAAIGLLAESGTAVRMLIAQKPPPKMPANKTVLFAGIFGGGFWAISILTAVPLSASNPIAAVILINAGFFAAGLGIGPIFPAYILASAEIPGVPPSLGIARIGVISIAGYFIGPTITGFISELTTLPTALMYPAGALVLSGYLAR